ARERPNIVLTKRSWALALVKAARRRVQPCRLDDEPVDLPQLGQVDPLTTRPIKRLRHRLRVNPLRRLRIPLHLEVFGQFLASDGLPFAQQLLDFLQDEGIALDGRGVVRLLVPDSFPDPIRFEGKREAADTM